MTTSTQAQLTKAQQVYENALLIGSDVMVMMSAQKIDSLKAKLALEVLESHVIINNTVA